MGGIGRWYERKNINMEERIVKIINKTAEYLNIEQLKKLQEVVLQELSENEPQKENITNEEYINRFLNVKQMEGCSDRTIQYYRVTVEHFLNDIKDFVRKIKNKEEQRKIKKNKEKERHGIYEQTVY